MALAGWWAALATWSQPSSWRLNSLAENMEEKRNKINFLQNSNVFLHCYVLIYNYKNTNELWQRLTKDKERQRFEVRRKELKNLSTKKRKLKLRNLWLIFSLAVNDTVNITWLDYRNFNKDPNYLNQNTSYQHEKLFYTTLWTLVMPIKIPNFKKEIMTGVLGKRLTTTTDTAEMWGGVFVFVWVYVGRTMVAKTQCKENFKKCSDQFWYLNNKMNE